MLTATVVGCGRLGMKGFSDGHSQYRRRAFVYHGRWVRDTRAIGALKFQYPSPKSCRSPTPKKKWCWQHRHPEIRLDVHIEKGKLIIEVNDHGQRFDLASYRPENIDARIQEMKTDGYGISIMRTFMDEVTYSSSDAAGNTLRLVKYLKNP